MKQLQRRMPVRVTYVGVGTLAYLATPLLLHVADLGAHTDTVYTALMALLGLITAAIGGDTYRPSGHATAGVTPLTPGAAPIKPAPTDSPAP